MIFFRLSFLYDKLCNITEEKTSVFGTTSIVSVGKEEWRCRHNRSTTNFPCQRTHLLMFLLFKRQSPFSNWPLVFKSPRIKIFWRSQGLIFSKVSRDKPGAV